MANTNKNLPATGGDEKPQKKSLQDIQVPNWVGAVIIIAFLAIGAFVYFVLMPKAAKETDLPVDGANSGVSSQVEAGDAVNVEVLPQTERTFGEDGAKNPFKTEDLSTVLLTGIIETSNGRMTAIVETGNASYIVNTGDVVKDSNWTVETITQDSITFVNGQSRKTIYMSKE
ncbi:MAG: hypothetical protein RR198_01460 [Oscillospiraceae bacterium]